MGARTELATTSVHETLILGKIISNLFTGNTKGPIPETTGYLYSEPFYGCIQSITVMTENKKFEVKKNAVDFSEDVIEGSGSIGPQACSVIATRTTNTDK